VTWSNVRGAAMTLQQHSVIAAPADQVWAALTAPDLLPHWLPGVERVAITSARKVGPEVRRIVYYAGGRQTDEETLIWLPPTTYAYTILRGLPLWTHRATFTLAPHTDNGQTGIVWEQRFEAAIPDRQLALLVAHLEATMAAGLANLGRWFAAGARPT
jgi:hypothetical protein